jgi:hypothetical protein
MDVPIGKIEKKRSKASTVMIGATSQVGEEPPSSAFSLDMHSSGLHLNDMDLFYGNNSPSLHQESSQKKTKVKFSSFFTLRPSVFSQ